MSELHVHLDRVQDIVTRASAFRDKEASDPEAFSKTVVEDLGVLAAAIAELIRRSEN
ncbi:hypothetical protein GCM10027421_28320 [Microbacterium shaanxiense]